MGTWKVDKHARTCILWDSPVDEPECSCNTGLPIRRYVTDWVGIVDHGLLMGMSTNEIAEDVGIKYQSIIEQLGRRGYKEQHEAMKKRRDQEVTYWRAHGMIVSERPRCAHGAWTSIEGECQHGKMGRPFEKEKAA